MPTSDAAFSTTEPTGWKNWWQSGRLSQQLLLLACVAGVAGLLASRALVALAPVAGVVAALANPHVRRQVPQWLRLRTIWAPAGLYGLLALSGLYTHNWPEWQHELFRQLPWLGVPLLFGLAVPLTGRQRFGVGCLFVLGLALIGAATVGQYLRDPTAANEAFRLGQSMPSVTRIFHIHFGLMLALAAFFGFRMARQPQAPRWLQVLLGLSVVVCVVVLHVLAYRSGLLAAYTLLLVEALLALLVRRRFWLGATLLLALAAGPWLAYHSLASVRERVSNTLFDLEQFELEHDINHFSLSRRLAAWQTATVVARQHPLLGVGPADAHAAMMDQYAWRSYGLLPANRVMVHNQYLHQLVAGGVVGLVLWLLVLLGPLAQPTLRRNPYVYRFVLLSAVAMLTDSLLELQTSYNLFVFLYGFLIVAAERRLRRPPKPSPAQNGINSIFV
ncbi:O-antigen ligase family protein [Hymenobacter sp. ISL-91]|uniref:O-antigen ligase family protein n=1 Tax=Hymenobacter sp. ISL-91 TaxID=2819151 RepID=UPI001BE89480|nr:O-antigen ligase family protein [Hymenobacter sp. ISL-91]MBT2558990.1 O-antigen ligase family protein [Hymenobacter sp. ISL-91]